MRTHRLSRPALLVILIPILAIAMLGTAAQPEKSKESPAEKLRKDLDQVVANVDIENQQLNLALDQLQEETKVPFVLDRPTIQQMGIDIDSFPVKAKLQNVKLRNGLRTILNPYGLAYAIVGESVVVTTEEMAVYRQLKQRVSIDVERVQLGVALKNLGRETATNLLLDARVQKEGQTPVTLQLDDVPLETAVRLMAEMSGLKPVRLGNVVLVTTKAHALELRAEPELAPGPRNANAEGGMMFPPGFPGFAGGLGVIPPGAAPPAKPQ